MTRISAHFDRREFACHCGCGFDAADSELLEVLEGLRQHFDQPIKITSGCRCPEHNAKVGGSPKSQHVFAKAADVQVVGKKPADVAAYLERLYPNTYGIGRYDGWVHIDVRTVAARWENTGANA
jgi:uncharacterized protein YcbK (DUF882 family)